MNNPGISKLMRIYCITFYKQRVNISNFGFLEDKINRIQD